MADTQRTVAAIKALLVANTTGDIGAQDLLDAVHSHRSGHGQIYVAAADAAAITIPDTTNYVEATNPAWTLTSGAHLWDESGGNGRLTYTGTVPMACHIACSISFTAASNQQIIHWRIGKNATPDAASEAQRAVSTGADVGSTALHLIQSMSNGDYLSLWARNATSGSNVTLEVANLQVVSMLI